MGGLAMGTDSIYKNCYVVVVHNDLNPYGRMVASYNTHEEALAHIRYQKYEMKSRSTWEIMHIKDVEFIPVPNN